MLIYDIEIVRAIPGPPDTFERAPDIEYCEGWDDMANMGISVICAYDYVDERYRVFLEDNFREFELLAMQRPVVGFNSIKFDDQVCQAHGLKVDTHYDVLVEIWRAAGLEPHFVNDEDHRAFTLDALSQINFNVGKVGHGALAPVLWQRGKRGQVIDYCLHDVYLTKMLVDRITALAAVRDVRSGKEGEWVKRITNPLVRHR